MRLAKDHSAGTFVDGGNYPTEALAGEGLELALDSEYVPKPGESSTSTAAALSRILLAHERSK